MKLRKASAKGKTVPTAARAGGKPDVGIKEFLALKKPKGDLTLEVGGERVSLTSLDRVYWPDEKLTKFHLLCYDLEVSPYLMPFLKDRPAILQRYPRGIKAPMFFQQDTSTAALCFRGFRPAHIRSSFTWIASPI